jgi:hypothetical protein
VRTGVLALLLAASLSSAPVAGAEADPPLAREATLAQASWDGDAWDEDDDEDRPRFLLSVWGGQALADAGAGRGSGFLGAEAAWALASFDLGIAGSAYRDLEEADRLWTPVVLARLTQRFRTRRGVEAAFGFGLGAGRPDDWVAWYQLALGVRVPLGPLFLGGEIAFERYEIIRLGAGLGVAF